MSTLYCGPRGGQAGFQLANKYALRLPASELRVPFAVGCSSKAQFKKADKSGACCADLGEDEVAVQRSEFKSLRVKPSRKI